MGPTRWSRVTCAQEVSFREKPDNLSVINAPKVDLLQAKANLPAKFVKMELTPMVQLVPIVALAVE
jgi:hypothetical protein